MSNYSEKFEKMRIAGKLASKTLDMLTNEVKEGVSTDRIDQLGYEFIRDNGGHSAPLYYRGFKKSLCTSLNHVVCHGIPSDRVLNEGDAVNIDVTAVVNEYYGDTSRMFTIGDISVKAKNLISNIDLGAVVVPQGALGGEAVLSCVERFIPLIVVSNKGVLNVSSTKMGLECLSRSENKLILHAKNYLEAAGLITALRYGINIKSLRRPIDCLIELNDDKS